MDELILLIAAEDLQAGAGVKRRTVSGIAYTGGKVAQYWCRYKLVMDLAGMQISAANIPLLVNHENRTASKIGEVAATSDGQALKIAGVIQSANDTAQGVIDQADAGGRWQLSIGAEIQAMALVEEGTLTVNGQEHTAPFYHVTQSNLREVSVVAVGADQHTALQVAASLTLNQAGVANMDPKDKNQSPESGEGQDVAASQPSQPSQQTPESAVPTMAAAAPPAPPTIDPKAVAAAAVRTERQRVAAIQATCAGDFHEIEAQAIAEEWTVDQTNAAVLTAIRASRPTADFTITIPAAKNQGDVRAMLEAAVSLRAGIPGDDLLPSLGERAVEAGEKNRAMGLQQLMIECAMLEGKTVPRTFGNETIRAAFSTVSLPGILGNVANKRLLRSYQAQRVLATLLCSTGDLNDFKESERYRLTDVGDLKPVAPDGEIEDGGLSEEKATNQLTTYAKALVLTEQMLYNDDLGTFLRLFDGLGGRAARLVDQLFFARLMGNPTMEDSKALFCSDHSNYATGTDTALDGSSLATGVQAFLDQTDSDGQPINIEPKYLLVPTALKMTAKELLNSTWLATVGGSTKASRQPTYNPFPDEGLTPLSSPYLSNSNYTGNSSLAWYLWGDPAVVDTFEIGYLRGQRVPIVDRGETDFRTLGLWYRVRFYIGVREQDSRGVYKALGEAAE